MELQKRNQNQQLTTQQQGRINFTTNLITPLIQENIEAFTKNVEKLTASIAIEKGSQISLLKAHDEAFVRMTIQLLIEDVLIHYNALDKFLDPVRKRTVQIILGKYWWMKLEEIAYVFKQGKSGAYGRSNKNISPDTFMEWIQNYDQNEREQYVLEANKKLQQQKQSLSDEEIKQLYKDAKEGKLSDPVPDGSLRNHERQQQSNEDYQKEKLKILNGLRSNS